MDRLWAMEVFIKVVEAGSLSRAARHLDLANASVSTCIRNLETYLGVTLLQRSTRHVSLTDEGRLYYQRCRDILALVDAAEAETSPSRTRLQGTLRLELPIALGHRVIGPALTQFARAHPDLKVMANLTNSVDNLIRRGVDVAILIDEIDDADLVARRIYESSHVLCAAPSFLETVGSPKHPGDIDPSRCIGFAASFSGKAASWAFHKDKDTHTIEPVGNLFFNSSDALLRSAARGAGFVYVLDVLAQDYLQRKEVEVVLPEWNTAKQTFYAVYPRSRFVPQRVKAFVAFLSDLMKTIE